MTPPTAATPPSALPTLTSSRPRARVRMMTRAHWRKRIQLLHNAAHRTTPLSNVVINMKIQRRSVLCKRCVAEEFHYNSKLFNRSFSVLARCAFTVHGHADAAARDFRQQQLGWRRWRSQAQEAAARTARVGADVELPARPQLQAPTRGHHHLHRLQWTRRQ